VSCGTKCWSLDGLVRHWYEAHPWWTEEVANASKVHADQVAEILAELARKKTAEAEATMNVVSSSAERITLRRHKAPASSLPSGATRTGHRSLIPTEKVVSANSNSAPRRTVINSLRTRDVQQEMSLWLLFEMLMWEIMEMHVHDGDGDALWDVLKWEHCLLRASVDRNSKIAEASKIKKERLRKENKKSKKRKSADDDEPVAFAVEQGEEEKTFVKKHGPFRYHIGLWKQMLLTQTLTQELAHCIKYGGLTNPRGDPHDGYGLDKYNEFLVERQKALMTGRHVDDTKALTRQSMSLNA
jgi:hypothetical protein